MGTRAAGTSGHAHVAVVDVAYIPQGKTDPSDEIRIVAGKRLAKCPPEVLAQYLERGDVRRLDDDSTEANARAEEIAAPSADDEVASGDATTNAED